MKKKIFTLLLVAISAFACTDGLRNDIDDLKNKYNDLDSRLAKLEEHCKEMNTNISSLKTLVNVILNNDYILSITPITKDGKEIGYVITFAIHEPITIYHGQNGKDGADGKNGQDGKNGENGTNGQDGKDGADGITPIIGVAQDETDHAYYWTLNGEWLLDANGNRIPLTSRDGINGQDGQDGKDGKDGINGQDGITPRLKIENGYWFISYDDGVTWIQLGKAVGENGQDGKDGTNGQDGEKGDKGDPGEPGYSMFTEVTQDDEFVYFTLYNGTVLTVRKGNSTFDQTIIDNLVTSLTLDQTEVWMSAIGETVQITATTVPFPTSKVYWSSSDSTIVSVAYGLLTAIRTGQVTITAKAGDKSQQLEAYVSIGDGLLCGEFSISPTQKVHFSKGRLQYNPAQGTHRCADGTFKQGIWRFAENQYDTLGLFCTDSGSNSYCDLFLYGSSGYDTYVPWGGWGLKIVKGNLDEHTDWGRYNAIDNGDNIPDQWRCLTREEWAYINSSRVNASNLRTTGYINGVSGVIILPDNCTLPTNAKFGGALTMPEWNLLEQYGAVFIPYSKENIQYAGRYYNVMDWTASWVNTNNPAYSLAWNYEFGIHSRYDLNISTASVRLVKEVE